jgi:hypothetical protein
MKKMYLQPVRRLRLLLPAVVCLLYALAPQATYGQTYYSTFATPTGKYSVTEPSGEGCNAPAVQNPSAFADADVNNYTFFRGTITSPLACTNNNYIFDTYLKLSLDSLYVSGGVQAGFRIRIPTRSTADILKQNLSIQTFLLNTEQESFSGSNVHIIDLATDSTRFIVYGNTTKNFNRLQLTVNGNIIPLNVDFEFDVQYALASNTDLLPVTISNFKAIASGSNVSISWQSLNEVNMSGYRIERSSNNGASYNTVATLPAKGGGSAINYSYTDKAVGNGNYLYRVVAIDKDGSSKPTNAVLVTIAGKTYLVLMPSIVRAGQTVVINNPVTGSYGLAVYDLQGRIVKQQQVNSGVRATINTGGLSAGTYVVKIITASGSVSEAKFVVN